MTDGSDAYNGANELVSMTGPNGTVTYAYDGLGRLTSRSLGGFVASYEYHHGELLTAVTTNFPGEASFSLEYDGLGRLRQVEAAGEDPLGFNYAGGAWANSTEDHTGARERSWNGGEGLSFGHPATGDHFYIAADHLGTARGYYDGSKTRVLEREYGPYGEPMPFQEPVEGLLRGYTGHLHEASQNLYLAPYRAYSPEMNRWLTRDPLGMVDGPNLYAYVRGNPVSFVDPMGGAAALPWQIPAVASGVAGGFIGGGAGEFAAQLKCGESIDPGKIGQAAGEGAVIGGLVTGTVALLLTPKIPRPSADKLLAPLSKRASSGLGAVVSSIIDDPVSAAAGFFGDLVGGSVTGGILGGLARPCD